MSLTKPDKHISLLDQARGFAIIAVFIYHALIAGYGMDSLNWHGWFRDFHAPWSFLLLLPVTFGWGGVAIFFVISGFCIHLSYERSTAKQFKVFFARRFFRIYPPYLVTLIFFAVFFPPTKLGFHSFRDFAQLVSHLFLLHNMNGNSSYAINGPFWSIAVEVQLYVLYPLLLWLVRRFGWKRALCLTVAIELTMRTIRGWHYAGGQSDPTWFSLSPFAFWFSWSAGAVLADDFLKEKPLFLRESPLWLWPSITLLCYFIKPLFYFCFVSIALSTANIMAYLLSRPISPRRQKNFALASLSRHLGWIGVISYSVYLIHDPLISLVPILLKTLFPASNIFPTINFICCLLIWPFVLFVSYGFYRWVEKPSIKLGKWFIRSKLMVSRA